MPDPQMYPLAETLPESVNNAMAWMREWYLISDSGADPDEAAHDAAWEFVPDAESERLARWIAAHPDILNFDATVAAEFADDLRHSDEPLTLASIAVHLFYYEILNAMLAVADAVLAHANK